MNTKTGYIRVVGISPVVHIANPEENAKEVKKHLASQDNADIIVFPELNITGYSCADLFRQQSLLDATEDAIKNLCLSHTEDDTRLVFVGAPVRLNGKLYNCAIVLNKGKIIGIVPKNDIPNYNEFYERRWFAVPSKNDPKHIDFADQTNIPFGTDLLFKCGNSTVFCEICESLWVPIPPSSFAAIAGANVLVNLSASNETVGKADYRLELIKNQSGRCLAAYIYVSAGPSESTQDVVFSGHCVIAENNYILSQSSYIGDGQLTSTLNLGINCVSADVDIEKLERERQIQSTFADSSYLLDGHEFRTINWDGILENKEIERKINGFPFVPSDLSTLDKRCAAIFDLQCAGLMKRLQSSGVKHVTIGVSGGLDSTLALLVAHKTFQICGLPIENIKAFTMPGFGTTSKTKNIANTLMKELGVSAKTIDIRATCLQMFRDMDHKPFGIDIDNSYVEAFTKKLTELDPDKRHDLIFENTQARIRTNYLMNSGFTIGTGDMSEAALGWCTYNGDHMSMYNVNCSIPKTLVRFLVYYVAKNKTDNKKVQDALMECVNMTISPELLPASADGKSQSTEDTIGSYVLHDFFLFNFIRNGYSAYKIKLLASKAEFIEPLTNKKYTFSKEEISKTLDTFMNRFFTQQFKRDCVPDGPKVGSVSLSPRGDWRMPPDASALIFK